MLFWKTTLYFHLRVNTVYQGITFSGEKIEWLYDFRNLEFKRDKHEECSDKWKENGLYESDEYYKGAKPRLKNRLEMRIRGNHETIVKGGVNL